MRVLAMKPGHDGSIAFVEDGRLIYSIEAEKDSFGRYSEVTASLVLRAMEMAPKEPDVVAIGGWHKYLPGYASKLEVGYFGLAPGTVSEGRFFGKLIPFFSSSHERSHIFMATGMVPNAPLEECVVLVWEGVIGALYHWQDYGATITKRHVLTQPEARYAALFGLADSTLPDAGADPRLEDAGKLMALTAYADDLPLDQDAVRTLEALLTWETLYPFEKGMLRDSPLYNCGLDSPLLFRAAQHLTNRIFEIFFKVASNEMPGGVPLLISGGCGLNCDWNQRWIECGHFSSVFVPPCANDSGSAIGTAIDAATHFGDPCRLDWNVYAGAPFRHDSVPNASRWDTQPLSLSGLAEVLRAGHVVAWVQGRYEIGPRALGHRSLLATPLDGRMKDRLNAIKERESYRPIAPCSTTEDLRKWFTAPTEDPYMLYFSKVETDALPAVTHVDGSARVQSLTAAQEPVLHRLLETFRGLSGYGVLCNTSLNYRGHGFLNSMSELVSYCEIKGVEEIVVDHQWFRRKSS
jgi:hydroxymethyl cephem carbamoyltransferase